MTKNNINSLMDVLDCRLVDAKEQLIYKFYTANSHIELTYDSLANYASGIATELEKYVDQSSRVILLYPSGLDFISALFACFYSKVIAIPVYSFNLNIEKLIPRLVSIVQDTAASVILTTSAVVKQKQQLLALAPCLQQVTFIATDDLLITQNNLWQPREIDPQSIAFLQYSSGSTGSPKGVMVTHHNLMSNLKIIQKTFGLMPNQNVVSWLPHYHDMGLIGNILGAMYSQTPLHIFASIDFVRKPLRWLELISSTRAVVSGGPNFAYEFCNNYIKPQQCDALDLSCWEVAYNGAEVVRESTLKRFETLFAPYGFKAKCFHPCYGLAESTLMVASSEKNEPYRELFVDSKSLSNGVIKTAGVAENTHAVVSSGKIQDEHRVVIVDTKTNQPCEHNIVGEIWTQGPSVCKGYWNKPSETEHTFSARLNGQSDSWLRTGDLGFFDDDGWLYVTGRLKDLIIIRGQNHSPEDIENTVLASHPLLERSRAIAFSQVDEDQEHLILLVTQPKNCMELESEILDAIQKQVLEKHELSSRDIHFIKRDSIPLTSSGKIRRGECKRLFAEGLFEFVDTPTNPKAASEKVMDSFYNQSADTRFALLLNSLQKMFAQELGVPLEQINIVSPLSKFALDSLSKVRIQYGIQELTGIETDPEPILKSSNLIELARVLADTNRVVSSESELTVSEFKDKDQYSLSEGQNSLFFLNKLYPENPAYIISRAVAVQSHLDIDALEQAFKNLVNRHIALRTRFIEQDGMPVQSVLSVDEYRTNISVVDASTWSETELDEQLTRVANTPFDLSAGLMARLFVFKTASAPVLLLSVHHVVSDLTSMTILVSELCELYSAIVSGRKPVLTPLAASPSDYIRYEEQLLCSEKFERMKHYWQQELLNHVEPLDLPSDKYRPPIKSYRGRTSQFTIPQSLTEKIHQIAIDKGVTDYVVLLSAYAVLLHRYTGKSNVIIGSPMANRLDSRFANMVSYLANPVPILTNFSERLSFDGVLEQVRQKKLTATLHQQYPIARIIEDLKIQRDTSTTPLFQAMFSYLSPVSEEDLTAFALGQAGTELTCNDVRLKMYPIVNTGAQFDLNVGIGLVDNSFVSTWEYSTDLFELATIKRMQDHFQLVLEQMVTNSHQYIDSFPMLSSDEKQQIVLEWNDTEVAYDLEKPLHVLFEQQVEKTPDSIAVLDKNICLSYQEFNCQANQLAHYLIELGVGPGTIVAVQMYRSIDMLVALYAILKAGGAYLPLDPDYPKKHYDWVIEDAQAKVILTHEKPDVADKPLTNPNVAVHRDHIAYIIYTSGSTGKPKGVMVLHGGICNRLIWMQETYKLNSHDRILQKTPYTFDVSVWELFWPLITGASLYISKPDGHKDPYYLASVIQQQQISTVHFVPSMLKPFLDNPQVTLCTSLKRIFCSGEALNPVLARLCLDKLGADLYNLYGPTEASVDVSAWQCPRNAAIDRVLIGKPIANMQLFILDQFMQPVPVGVHGELYIGGVGLAQGYLNRPELTAERFVNNPFSRQSKLYKTGDLCRFHPDGNIEYLGRIDNQVKIRGFRIELEEVETAICTHPEISEAVALANKEASDSARLEVYYVALGQEIPSASDLRAWLGERLPEHMLPSVYIPVSVLPRLSNGKLDRNSLPKAETIIQVQEHKEYVGPNTKTEQLLCSVYEQILAVERVGIHDNFFELGGDSIMGLRAVSMIREFGFDVGIQQLYSNSTVSEVATVIEKNRAADLGNSRKMPAFGLISTQDRDALPTGIDDAYPLSKMQEGLVFHSEFSPDYEIYVMGMHVEIQLDHSCLHKALSILNLRHPLLRTAFDHVHFSEPLQIVYADVKIPVHVIDIQHLSMNAQEQEVERFMREEKWRKFDWSKAPFLRIAVHQRSDRSNQFTFSHPLFDGWSMGLLITEFFSIYGALLKNQEVPLDPAPPIGYRDFVALERQTIHSEASVNYWKQLLADSNRSELPRFPTHRKSGPGAHIRMTVKVSSETLSGLQQLATVAEAPLKSVLLAAHMRVVGLLTGRKDVTTGLLVNGRPEQLHADKVIGMFLNTIPFRVQLQGRDWIELVKDTFESERNMLPHRRFPLSELVRTYGKGKQLFDTAFNYIHFHIYKNLEQVPDLSVLGWKSPSDQTYFPLTAYFHLDISQASSELLFFLDVDTGVLAEEQIDALQHYYLNTLNSMAADFYSEYRTIPLLSTYESRKLLKDWNGNTDTEAEKNVFVHHLFSQQAQLNPNKIAVTMDDIHLTYAELEQRSNRLAHYLANIGVTVNRPVAVFVNRSPDLIIALLGVLKAGGYYVPLDPVYPKDRLTHMLEDSQTSVVLTQTSLTHLLPEGKFQNVLMDADWPLIDSCSALAPEIMQSEEDLAYIIYTSGSTGKPKGVEIPHRALGNFIHSMRKILPWTQQDSLLAVTTISFDIAGLEIYLPLTSGAHVLLASQELAMDGINLAEVLAKQNVTVMQATPATWRMLISAGWRGRKGLKVLCGGERMPQDLAKALLDRGCNVWNMYGPTETTIWSTVCQVESSDDVIPIGKPISNTPIYVLDEFGLPVPTGVAGELYISGRGLAKGYHNLPELTAEKFCIGLTGDLMYKTGDLVRYKPDGMLEYLSRMDQQVKVRGFRIELGDIEAALNAVEGITKAVTKIISDGFGDNQVVAWIVQAPGQSLKITAIRSRLLELLPAYMVPSSFVMLEEFPMTLNGKIDYKALPEPTDRCTDVSETYLPPENDLQQKIADIFASVLSIERVGIDDNFFDLGGHSLALVRVHIQLQELLGRKIPIIKLFEHTTIRKMAALFETQEKHTQVSQTNQLTNTRRDWLERQKNRRKTNLNRPALIPN